MRAAEGVNVRVVGVVCVCARSACGRHLLGVAFSPSWGGGGGSDGGPQLELPLRDGDWRRVRRRRRVRVAVAEAPVGGGGGVVGGRGADHEDRQHFCR